MDPKGCPKLAKSSPKGTKMNQGIFRTSPGEQDRKREGKRGDRCSLSGPSFDKKNVKHHLKNNNPQI